MAESIINLYGDSLISTTGTHGGEIASQRIDDLDKRALADLLGQSKPRIQCVDIGCGFGWQGIRFAILGASAHLFDVLPESTLLQSLRANSSLLLSYTSGDLRGLDKADLPECIDLAFSQRFFHYLTFFEAQRLVGLIAERLVPGGFFYISASGLQSELGENYIGRDIQVKNRFALLSVEMQAKHNISKPVCLYTESELTQLMLSSALSPQKVWTSPFGNIKGVYQKPQ
jgi:SAM-dependent methyltransferase